MGILSQTPLWVYVLLIFLLILGISSLRSKTVSFHRLVLLPVIFALWNLSWLFSHLEGKYYFFLLWGIGIVFGAVIGWQSVRSWKIHADHRKKQITIPGSYSTLVLILLIFGVRYYFNYNEAVNPNITEDTLLLNAGISGLFTGVFIGRALELYRKYKSSRN